MRYAHLENIRSITPTKCSRKLLCDRDFSVCSWGEGGDLMKRTLRMVALNVVYSRAPRSFVFFVSQYVKFHLVTCFSLSAYVNVRF